MNLLHHRILKVNHLVIHQQKALVKVQVILKVLVNLSQRDGVLQNLTVKITILVNRQQTMVIREVVLQSQILLILVLMLQEVKIKVKVLLILMEKVETPVILIQKAPQLLIKQVMANLKIQHMELARGVRKARLLLRVQEKQNQKILVNHIL